jgi:hypothetical protein
MSDHSKGVTTDLTQLYTHFKSRNLVNQPIEHIAASSITIRFESTNRSSIVAPLAKTWWLWHVLS